MAKNTLPHLTKPHWTVDLPLYPNMWEQRNPRPLPFYVDVKAKPLVMRPAAAKWRAQYEAEQARYKADRQRLKEAGFKTIYHKSKEAAEAEAARWNERLGLKLEVHEGCFLCF